MKTKVMLISCIATAFLTTGTAFASTAPSQSLTGVQTSKLLQQMKQAGIKSKIQRILIDKLNHGILLDSNNLSYLKTVPEPSLSHPTVEKIFPDGSKVIRKLTVNRTWTEHYNVAQPNTPPPATVSGGQVEDGSGYVTYYDVTVSENDLDIWASYNADISFVNGGATTILRVYNPSASSLDGTLSNKSLSIIRKTNQVVYGAPALAEYHFSWTFPPNFSEQSVYLDLEANQSSYWATGDV